MSGSNVIYKVTPLYRHKLTPLYIELRDRIKRQKQTVRRSKKSAIAIRQIYLTINRGPLEDLPVRVLVSLSNRIPYLIRIMRDNSKINEKYCNVLITTFSKYKKKYNSYMKIHVEKVLLIRELIGYDLSKVVNNYLDYE